MKYIDKKLIVSTIIVAIILAFVLIEQCKYIKISDNDLVEIQEKFDYYEKKKFREAVNYYISLNSNFIELE